MKRMEQIIKNFQNGHHEVSRGWVEPAPFPQGRHGYPTRIAYIVKLRKQKELRYVGKPTRQAVSIVYDAMRRRDCQEVLLMEFDRKNLIGEYFTPGRSNGIAAMTGGNTALLHLYHPFDSEGGTVVIPYFLNKFHIKRLTMGNRKYTYYSPFERLKIKTQIDPFRLWIAQQRRLPYQPKEAPQVPNLRFYYQDAIRGAAPFFDIPEPREFEP